MPTVRSVPLRHCALCGAPVQARGNARASQPYVYCSREHYNEHRSPSYADRPSRARRSDHGIRRAEWVTAPCLHCGEPVTRRASKGLGRRRFCNPTHHHEWMANGGSSYERPVGATKRNNKGYILEKTATGWVMQHRVVLAARLGRELRSDEYVHHRNGVRDDNVVGNLELWTTMQPAGKRPSDLVAFAREVLERYADEIIPEVA